jgi:uncharacterized protein YfeS
MAPTAAPTNAPTKAPTKAPTPAPTPDPNPCASGAARALTDHDQITLTDASGRSLDWDDDNGRVAASPSKGSWIMKKCISGDCSRGALGSSGQWTSAGSAASALKTCDVVSWYNAGTNRIYDCAWGTCTNQVYPLPAGHWGSPFKIRKEGVGCGVALTTEDSNIYFSRMYSGVFNDAYYLQCNGSTCMGTTNGAKTAFHVALKGATRRTNAISMLTDHTIVRMHEGGKWLNWDDNNGQITANPVKGDWIMKKCISGDCSTGALGSSGQWTSTNSATSIIKTCDVVSWYNADMKRIYDCAWGACTNQVFPLPAGHWGSPFKIRKEGVGCGVAISAADTGIFFSRMYSGVFNDAYYLQCNDSTCMGTTNGAKSVFALKGEGSFCKVGGAALTDKSAVTLTEVGGTRKLNWDDNNGQIATSAPKGTWNMKKCISGDCSTGALGSSGQWTSAGSAASPLKTCDVVSWYNTAMGRIYDCAWGACTNQVYPLPAGHWGSPFKIRQQGQPCGVAISAGDSNIYFSRMYSGVFNDAYYLQCSGSTCMGTTNGAKTLFTIA